MSRCGKERVSFTRMKKQISFIYFDLGGVVIDNEQTKRGLAWEFQLDTEAIQAFFDANWRESCLGNLDNKAYLRDFKNAFGIEHPKDDFVDFITEYQGHYQETHDLIRELTGGYRLGILSNAELGSIDVLLRKGKIPDVKWDTLIESAQVRAVKPDRKIYDIAQKHAGVSPDEILFIDDRKPNIDAALSLGWNAELFDYFDLNHSVQRIKTKLHKKK